jgi:hypothetical protein
MVGHQFSWSGGAKILRHHVSPVVGGRRGSSGEPLGFDDLGDTITLADVFDNGQDDPATLAARKLDGETFMGM